MTDESPQLSRRERRAQEAREAARRAEDTASLDMSPISDSIPTHAPDGRVLSRRERRRLERLQSPVETWTAEEEMIATGQIPAMTPERIAEQERIAREKAEQAQADALTASQELPTVTGGQPTSAESDGEDEHDGRGDDEAEPPQRSSLMAAAAQAPEVEPPVAEPKPEPGSESEAASESEATEVDAPEPEPEPEPEPAPEPEAAAAWAAAAEPEPEPVQESTPEPDSEPEPEPEPEPDAEQPVPQATPLGMPPGMSPEMFAALFPPGSLQRRLMEQQSQTPLPLEADATATEQAASEPVEDGVAEIRRLSQEAVASIDAASARSAASAPATPSPEPWEDTQAPPAASTPEPSADAPSGSAQQWEWHAEPAPPTQEAPEATATEPASIDQDGASTPGLWQASASAASAPDGAEPAPHSGPIRLDAEDFRERAASQQSAPSFDAILGTGDAAQTAALDDISTGEVAAGGSTFDTVREPSQPALEALSSASAPVTGQWATLPLNQVDHRAQELPEVAPRADIQHPDLSSVRRPTFSPQADYSHIEPVPTGQIEVPPREKPQLNPAGGARHFRWVHVLVLGAVAFLIGVVVWNVWGGPS